MGPGACRRGNADGRQQVLWRVGSDWRPIHVLERLIFVHGVLPVHRLRAACWPFSCDEQRNRPSEQRQHSPGVAHDSDQLLHIPDCIIVPNARHLRSAGGCFRSDRLLRS